MHCYQYLLLLIPFVSSANSNDTLFFNRVIYPKKLSYISKDYSQDKFIGADYKNKFTVVIQIKKETGKLNNISVIPAEQDSVVIGRNITSDMFSRVKYIGNLNEVYEIDQLDSLLNFVIIRKLNNNQIKPDISVFYPTIKNIKIRDINGVDVLLSNYLEREKFLYIDFWGLWCHQCIKDVYDLKKIYLENSDILNILYLNYRDSTDEIQSFINKKNITWDYGITNDFLNRIFFVEWFPFGVLVDDKGEIILLPCSLQQLKIKLNDKHCGEK